MYEIDMIKSKELRRLIRLGLWEQATIYGGDSTMYIKKADKVITTFYDWEPKYFRVFHIPLDGAEI